MRRGALGGRPHMRASCSDAAGWLNAFSSTCATYLERGWCEGGTIRNQSAIGSIFGAPEMNCCACGRGNRPPAPPSRATQLVFVAAHKVDAAVTAMLTRLSRDIGRLRSRDAHRPWLLLFNEHPPDGATVDRWRLLDADVCTWSLEQVFHLFPKLERAYKTSSASGDLFFMDATYLQHYYLFHSSLAVWHTQFGASFPRLTHLWRVEPDVALVGIGGWAALLSRASKVQTDVLLPRLISEADSEPTYTHWQLNKAFTERVPPRSRAWSLVCVGRYSLAFLLQIMWPQWAEGMLAYEEIFLPTSCLARRGSCSIATFGALVDAKHVRYRPPYDCVEFQRGANARPGTLAFWHPLKDAQCVDRVHASQNDVSDAKWRGLPFLPLPPPSPPRPPPIAPQHTFVFRKRARRDELVHHASVG